MPAVYVVAQAAARPSFVIIVGFLVAGTSAGTAVGTLGPPLHASAWAAAMCVTSLVAHESAHLVALRASKGHRAAGAVGGSMTDVWCIVPPLPATTVVTSAILGPLAGAFCCAAWGFAGAPAWIAVAVGCVHLANLLPVLPDGRRAMLGVIVLVTRPSR